MIIRKPYAFLIKNFRKVHIVLLLLSFLIFRATLQTTTFLSEFTDLQSYNPIIEPISRYLSIFTYASVIFMLVVVGMLIYLLWKKEKPWRMYLILFAIYAVILIIFLSTTMYFVNFTNSNFELKTARMLHDFMFVVNAPQFLAFVILVIRILGIDLEKFDFANDEEFLEIQESDKEEVEISFEFDRHIFNRLFQKFLRYFQYFYEEHKFIVNVLVCVVVVIIIWNLYYFFGVTHKSYKQGKTLNVSGYSITVNNTYYTDKDYMGETIEKGKAFVILDMTVKNRGEEAVMKMDNFHLMNWSNDYTYTVRYNTDFNDLGKPYSNDKWQPNKEYNFLLIFKVDEKNAFSNYVLYYQEYHNRMETYLRKMKLKVVNLGDIENRGTKNLGQEVTFELMNGKKKSVIFTNAEIGEEFDYKLYKCTAKGCMVRDSKVQGRGSYQIIKLTYDSADFDGKDFVDFSTNYGKISYVDNKGKEKSVDVVDAIDREYQGRYLYLRIPKNINAKKKIEITYVIRNKKYVYKIK